MKQNKISVFFQLAYAALKFTKIVVQFSIYLSIYLSINQVQGHCEALGHPNIEHHYQHCPEGGAHLALIPGSSYPRGHLL